MLGVVIAIGAGLYIVSRAFSGHKKGETVTEDQIGDAEITDDAETCFNCDNVAVMDCEYCGNPVCDDHAVAVICHGCRNRNGRASCGCITIDVHDCGSCI